jgi:hypothetical protein
VNNATKAICMTSLFRTTSGGTSGDPTITTTTTSVPAIANNARASPHVSSFANQAPTPPTASTPKYARYA